MSEESSEHDKEVHIESQDDFLMFGSHEPSQDEINFRKFIKGEIDIDKLYKRNGRNNKRT